MTHEFFFTKLAIFALISFISLMNTPVLAQEKEIKIVGGKSLKSPSTQYLIKLYSEAFRRIGYKFIYERMPNNRASIHSDEGKKYAGELSRVANYNTKHPKLTKLEIPHYSVKFIAISAKYPKLELNGWESLTGKKLKVAYRRGTKIIEDNLPKLLPEKGIFTTAETEQGLKLIEFNRVDIFLEGSVNVARFFQEKHYRESKLYFPGVMQQLDIHMFIHNNYGALIPKLNSVMKKMHAEGLFVKYRKASNFSELQMR